MRFVLLILLSQVLAFAAIDIEPYQSRWTRAEIEERLGNFLQKQGNIGSYFSITDEAFTLYNAPDSQSDRMVDFRLKFAKEKRGLKKLSKRKNLVGLKIAIDPGHLGGPFARLEQRFIDLPPSLGREEIQFDEGSLSLLTALYLKTLLEKEGAHVFLTRTKIGEGVYHEPFFDWLSKKPELWKGEISLSRIFCKYYNPLDLRARAEKINAFSPDLTLMIHYNSEDPPAGGPSNNTLIASNYNMVFVPGSFCRGELTEYENRFHPSFGNRRSGEVTPIEPGDHQIIWEAPESADRLAKRWRQVFGQCLSETRRGDLREELSADSPCPWSYLLR